MAHQNGTPSETYREVCILCQAEMPLGLLDCVGVSRNRMGTLRGQQTLPSPETSPPLGDCGFICYVSLKWNDCVLIPHSRHFICIPFIYSNVVFLSQSPRLWQKKKITSLKKNCALSHHSVPHPFPQHSHFFLFFCKYRIQHLHKLKKLCLE